MLSAGNRPAEVRAARALFAAASRLQPANADTRNLTLMADLWLSQQGPQAVDEPLRAADALLDTLGLTKRTRCPLLSCFYASSSTCSCEFPRSINGLLRSTDGIAGRVPRRQMDRLADH